MTDFNRAPKQKTGGELIERAFSFSLLLFRRTVHLHVLGRGRLVGAEAFGGCDWFF